MSLDLFYEPILKIGLGAVIPRMSEAFVYPINTQSNNQFLGQCVFSCAVLWLVSHSIQPNNDPQHVRNEPFHMHYCGPNESPGADAFLVSFSLSPVAFWLMGRDRECVCAGCPKAGVINKLGNRDTSCVRILLPIVSTWELHILFHCSGRIRPYIKLPESSARCLAKESFYTLCGEDRPSQAHLWQPMPYGLISQWHRMACSRFQCHILT